MLHTTLHQTSSTTADDARDLPALLARATLITDAQSSFHRGGQHTLFAYTPDHRLNDFSSAAAYPAEDYATNDVVLQDG